MCNWDVDGKGLNLTETCLYVGNMMSREEIEEKRLEYDISKLLKGYGFNFLMGDCNFLTHGGKFYKTSDNEIYTIIEIMNCNEYYDEPNNDFVVILSTVWLDKRDKKTLKSALECCGYNHENYKRITRLMKIEALHSYHGGDMITSIEGNKITDMIEWIIDADERYPYIQEYTEDK